MFNLRGAKGNMKQDIKQTSAMNNRNIKFRSLHL